MYMNECVLHGSNSKQVTKFTRKEFCLLGINQLSISPWSHTSFVALLIILSVSFSVNWSSAVLIAVARRRPVNDLTWSRIHMTYLIADLITWLSHRKFSFLNIFRVSSNKGKKRNSYKITLFSVRLSRPFI